MEAFPSQTPQVPALCAAAAGPPPPGPPGAAKSLRSCAGRSMTDASRNLALEALCPAGLRAHSLSSYTIARL